MTKTFYEFWSEGQTGFTNLGSFHTNLMLTYRIADEQNKEILDHAFPQYFVMPHHFAG